MALTEALRCLGCIGSLPESWWCPHRPCASLGQEGQRQLDLVQLILTDTQTDTQTDRQTDRHTVRAAPVAVLAPGPEAMWKARSGFSSTRTNLSPFTKDFRGAEHPRVYGIFGSSASAEHHLSV